MTLGDNIKTRRQEIRMSQEMLAERVGVSRQAVTKWEAGQSEPSSENLYRLAEVLGVTVEGLLPPAQSPAAPKPRLNRWQLAALVGFVYLALWLTGRLVFGVKENYTVLGWLTGWQSTVYLFGWLLSQKLYWCAMGLSCLAALLNKRRLAMSLTAGFFLGWGAGELFGPRQFQPQAGVEYHYGWATWAVIYLISILAGILWEKKRKK